MERTRASDDYVDRPIPITAGVVSYGISYGNGRIEITTISRSRPADQKLERLGLHQLFRPLGRCTLGDGTRARIYQFIDPRPGGPGLGAAVARQVAQIRFFRITSTNVDVIIFATKTAIPDPAAACRGLRPA